MKKQLLMIACALSLLSASAGAVDLSANAALVSEYIFRGIPQTDGNAAVQGGIDLEQSGFYAGSWFSEVDNGDSDSNDGLEIDYYGGYGGELGEFTYGIGATWYTYTDKFDDDYLELNLSGGWRFLTLDIAVGEYDNFDGPTQDYQFYSLTGEYENFYATVGLFEDDFDGEYYEIGYSNTVNYNGKDLFDYNFAGIYSTDDLLGGEDDINFYAGISKSFDLSGN